MKVATRRFSALLALSKVLTEGPHGLREKGERKEKRRRKKREETSILQGWERRETNQKNPKFELKEAYLV